MKHLVHASLSVNCCNTSGATNATLISVATAPWGVVRPCSQFCNVLSGAPSNLANCACDKPNAVRALPASVLGAARLRFAACATTTSPLRALASVIAARTSSAKSRKPGYAVASMTVSKSALELRHPVIRYLVGDVIKIRAVVAGQKGNYTGRHACVQDRLTLEGQTPQPLGRADALRRQLGKNGLHLVVAEMPLGNALECGRQNDCEHRQIMRATARVFRYTDPVTSRNGVIGIGVPVARRSKPLAYIGLRLFSCATTHGSLFGGPCGGTREGAPVLARYANPARSASCDWRRLGQFRKLSQGAFMADFTAPVAQCVATSVPTLDAVHLHASACNALSRCLRELHAEHPDFESVANQLDQAQSAIVTMLVMADFNPLH